MFNSSDAGGQLAIGDFQTGLKEFKQCVDAMFVLLMGSIICLLQSGFAMLEAGSVRAKNVTNILIKNFIDLCFGSLLFMLFGYTLAFTEGNEWIGWNHFALYEFPADLFPHAFMQTTFAATCATIVSGALAERCDFIGYLILSSLISSVIYPIATHWYWTTDGFFAAQGFTDFAGSAVVHLAGGMLSLAGSIIIGSRTSRWSPDVNLTGHSVPLICLGFFILNFGFLAFNGGSQGSISNKGDGPAFARAVVNTQLGCSAGGMTMLFLWKLFTGKFSLVKSINGALAGMVSLCAGCNIFEPWISLVVASIASMVYALISGLMSALRIDDPLDAVAVHAGGGIIGILAVPICMNEGLIFGYTDEALELLRVNAYGAGIIVAYNLAVGLVLFGILRVVGLLRIDKETERLGSDKLKHGEESYPHENKIQILVDDIK